MVRRKGGFPVHRCGHSERQWRRGWTAAHREPGCTERSGARDLAAEHSQRVARMKDGLDRSLALGQRRCAVAGEVDLSPEVEATLHELGDTDHLDESER